MPKCFCCSERSFFVRAMRPSNVSTRQQQTEDGGQVQPVRREKDTAHAQHRGQIRRDDGIVVKTDHVEFSRSKF